MLCGNTALKIAASFPSCWSCRSTPRLIVRRIHLSHYTTPHCCAAAISTGLTWSCSAVTRCRFPNSALDPASVPVSATPSHPSSVPRRIAPARARHRRSHDRVHARVARDVGQSEHEADSHQRGHQLPDRRAQQDDHGAHRHAEQRAGDEGAEEHRPSPWEGHAHSDPFRRLRASGPS